MLPLLGLVVGLVFCIGFAVVPTWRRFAIASVLAVASFATLWLLTRPDWGCGEDTTEIALRMCHQSVWVWDSFRLAVIGLPGLVAAGFWLAAALRLGRGTEVRRP